MGFNKRKMEDRRRQAAEQEAAARRATEKQILEELQCQEPRPPFVVDLCFASGSATERIWICHRCKFCRIKCVGGPPKKGARQLRSMLTMSKRNAGPASLP